MATEHTGPSEAILALARHLRLAISARQAMMQEALHAYDHAAGDRLDQATTFLRSVQRADLAYESSSQGALECFRESFEETQGW
jgi:hypothetical protein